MWRAPINGSLIWKRSIVGVEMTFGCHCCPLIKAPLTEGGRACCNILQLRLHSTLSTPRAPGVVLLKDTICTLFPVSSFWLSLLKLDTISLLSHASIQVFQHAFLVNQRRTCDLRGWAFFFNVNLNPSEPAQPLHFTQLVGLSLHLRLSKVMQPNFLALSRSRDGLSVLGAAEASWKPHDPHQTVGLP